jgi:hypothetical protein
MYCVEIKMDCRIFNKNVENVNIEDCFEYFLLGKELFASCVSNSGKRLSVVDGRLSAFNPFSAEYFVLSIPLC